MKEQRFILYAVLDNEEQIIELHLTRAGARESINANDDPTQGKLRIRRAKGVLFDT